MPGSAARLRLGRRFLTIITTHNLHSGFVIVACLLVAAAATTAIVRLFAATVFRARKAVDIPPPTDTAQAYFTLKRLGHLQRRRPKRFETLRSFFGLT